MDKGNQNLSETSFFTSAWGNLRNAIIGCSAAVVFGLVVLLMSILSVTNPSSVFPQDGATIAAEKVTPLPVVDYYLPYPGILPDSPLYTLKVIRDRVRLWLTFADDQKAQKELLYADKRINAALALVEGGKVSLGVSTATKAEKYLQRAVDRAVQLSARGQLLNQQKAVAKHAEILSQLVEQTSGSDRIAIETSLKLTLLLQEKVAQAIRE